MTGHGGAQFAGNEIDRGDGDKDQQDEEGDLLPFQHPNLLGEMQPDLPAPTTPMIVAERVLDSTK